MKKDLEKEKKRTLSQNRALHLYFTLLANKLNEAGLDMKAVLKPEVEIPWTSENVKNHLWRPVQKIFLEKTSTTELTTKDIDKIFDVITRHLAQHGIYEPFPSMEELLIKSRDIDEFEKYDKQARISNENYKSY